jgi:surface protein
MRYNMNNKSKGDVMTKRKVFEWMVVAVATIMLSACGGSGEGMGSGTSGGSGSTGNDENNSAPVAVADSITVAEDSGTISIDVLVNDTDEDNDTLQIKAGSVTAPNHGGIAVINGNKIDYTPAANFNGTESFDYIVNDGRTDGNKVTVTVMVTPVNDAPVAEADSVTVDETSSTISIDVLANDTDVDGDALQIKAGSITTPDSGGSAVLNGNKIDYTPSGSYHGIETFYYTVNDGTVDGSTTKVFVTIKGAFIIKVNTNNAGTTSNKQFKIPGYTGYDYQVDCNNDGVNEEDHATGEYTCTYSSAGEHTIAIRGDLYSINFNNQGDRKKLIAVEQWGSIEWQSFSASFYGCSNMAITARDVPYLYNVRYMSDMFRDATSLNKNEAMAHWDVSNVIYLDNMFNGATHFNQDISGWFTEDVSDMSGMFDGATAFNQDIGEWDTESVTSMSNMFKNATAFNQDIDDWNTSSVRDMSGMFSGAADFNKSIGSWDTGSVTDMSDMFNGAIAFNQDIGNWNTSSVRDMSGMFNNAIVFNQDIGNWDMTNVVYTDNMFSGASTFNQDIGKWGADFAPGDTSEMFKNATAFNQDIGDWNTSSVDDMSGMFSGAADFNKSIGSWDTGSVTDMSDMFKGATAFNQDIGNWKTGLVENMSGMFKNAIAFNQDIGNWDVELVRDMSNMFNGAIAFNQDIHNWDTHFAENMSEMFYQASNFSNQNLSGWDVGKVTDHSDFCTGWGSGNTPPGGWSCP